MAMYDKHRKIKFKQGIKLVEAQQIHIDHNLPFLRKLAKASLL